MLHLNQDRLTEQRECEMRYFLKRAVQELQELNGQRKTTVPLAAA